MPIAAIHERTKPSILTDAKKQAFLDALADCGSVVGAVAASGINRWFAYGERDKDADFAERWNMALQLYADKLDLELHNRAVVGEQDPIWYKDETGKPTIVGYKTKKSDSLFHVSLQANNPAKYGRKLEVAGSIQHNHKAELPEAVLSILDSLKAVNVTPPPCPDPDAQVIEYQADQEHQEDQPGNFGAIPHDETWRDSGAISGADFGAIIPGGNDQQDDRENPQSPGPAGWTVRKVEGQVGGHPAAVKIKRYSVE